MGKWIAVVCCAAFVLIPQAHSSDFNSEVAKRVDEILLEYRKFYCAHRSSPGETSVQRARRSMSFQVGMRELTRLYGRKEIQAAAEVLVIERSEKLNPCQSLK